MLRTSNSPQNFYFPSSSSSSTLLRCLGKTRVTRDRDQKVVVVSAGNGHDQRKLSAVAWKESVASENTISTNVTETALRILSSHVERKSWRQKVEMFFETAFIDCRFFTLFAVAGSLLGSILCFFEGCVLIIESYLNYFHLMLQNSDQGHVVELLIEAIDMFLLGTAMLIFGTGLYVFFVGSKFMKRGSTRLIPQSNFFGLFHLHMLPAWVEMKSVSEEKSKIGHAVLMILQVGVVEKFKNIPLVTGLDLACFAGAVLISSASIFILSRLSIVEQKVGGSHATTWFGWLMGQK
ncbi:uncharacterized protein LOC122072958 [Macadamia integrifolia]|uniref:uncharacterized protein LOC122072958 n=1 Tax=Macadamia integrifolia TaxID=60698 RepID=UPI001C4E6A4B|nr:uncharacterized protein LOC122072958 [Macadamia integrifolia]